MENLYSCVIVYSFFKMTKCSWGGYSDDRLRKRLDRGVNEKRFGRLKQVTPIIYIGAFCYIPFKGPAAEARLADLNQRYESWGNAAYAGCKR